MLVRKKNDDLAVQYEDVHVLDDLLNEFEEIIKDFSQIFIQNEF